MILDSVYPEFKLQLICVLSMPWLLRQPIDVKRAWLLGMLVAEFSSSKYSQAADRIVVDLHQNVGETPTDYARRFDRVFKSCRLTNDQCSFEHMRIVFLNGFSDANSKRSIEVAMMSTNFTSLLGMAKAVELNAKFVEVNSKPRSDHEYNAMETRSMTSSKRMRVEEPMPHASKPALYTQKTEYNKSKYSSTPRTNDCLRCFLEGHRAMRCIAKQPADVPRCSHCALVGHTADKCEAELPPCGRCGGGHSMFVCFNQSKVYKSASNPRV